MKVVLMGATRLPKDVAEGARKSGGRLWIALPDDASDEAIDRAAKKLDDVVRVIEVEMPLGLRGGRRPTLGAPCVRSTQAARAASRWGHHRPEGSRPDCTKRLKCAPIAGRFGDASFVG